MVAWIAGSAISPVSPDTPDGTSMATTLAPDTLTCSTAKAASPERGRESPAPNRPSSTMSSEWTRRSSSGECPPVQWPEAAAPSSVRELPGASSQRATSRPRSTRRWAATKASPPLLPGPARTTTRPSGYSACRMSAQACPALRISSESETPASTARCSQARTSSQVRMASDVMGPSTTASLGQTGVSLAQPCAGPSASRTESAMGLKDPPTSPPRPPPSQARQGRACLPGAPAS
jgi:hypothetical protein